MRLREIAKRLRKTDSVGMSSIFSEALQVSELTSEQLTSCSETIYLQDSSGALTGKISRELLKYLNGQQKQSTFFDILNCLESGIIAVDAAGRIYYANQAYTKLLNVPLSRIMGLFIQDVEPNSLLHCSLSQRRPLNSDKQLIPSIHKYVSLHAFPLWSGTEFVGAVSIFQDVTELHNLNKEVRKMTDIADEYSRQLQTLSTIHSMGIITQNKNFINLLSHASIIAKTDAPVLIRGENGVGKEVLANYIHQCSSRKDRPLITVNCAAIPSELLESELFGYEEGAFTGAKKGGKKGRFELADKGSIFLDEIGDMPITMQSKLLRVIQQGEIEKLGRQKKLSVDVRILVATNQPLEQMIQQKTFRQDLFFRLNTFTLQIPPLRNRPEDIDLLANHFLAYYNQKYRKNFQLSSNAYARISKASWPGNVRELQGCIERVVVLEDENLLLDTLTTYTKSSGALPQGSLRELLWEYEANLLQQVLMENRGNRKLAMEQLGLSRRTFYRKCAEHGLQGESFE